MDYERFKEQQSKPWYVREVPPKRIAAGVIILFMTIGIVGLLKQPLSAHDKAIDEMYRAQLESQRNPNAGVTFDVAKATVGAMCKIAIKKSLKSPKSADFPWTYDVIASSGNKDFTMTSYVDASNSYGAMIRTNFVCQVTYNGNDPEDMKNWALKGVSTF